jgi:hypothetical protein
VVSCQKALLLDDHILLGMPEVRGKAQECADLASLVGWCSTPPGQPLPWCHRANKDECISYFFLHYYFLCVSVAFINVFSCRVKRRAKISVNLRFDMSQTYL